MYAKYIVLVSLFAIVDLLLCIIAQCRAGNIFMKELSLYNISTS